MIEVILAVFPVFVILILGLFIRRQGLIGEDVWVGMDKLVYWVMFPAMLFHKTSSAPIGGDTALTYATILLPGIFISGLVIWCYSFLSQRPKPAISSTYQGAIRHNTYIGFAVVSVLLGEEGLLLAALATAIMVPFVNVLCVSTLITLHSPDQNSPLVPRLIKELFKNPLILSIAAGISCNLIGFGEIPVLSPVLGILTSAALPVALLCVGAGLRLRAIKSAGFPVVISAICKLTILPAVVIAGLFLTETTGIVAIIAVVFASLPTAASGYSLARQLGGDAPLIAGIITIQTLVSVLTLPACIILARYLF